MRQLKPWLLLGLVFLAGLVSGVVGTRQVVRHSVMSAIQNPDTVRQRIEKRLTSHLALTPGQQNQVHEILLNAHRQLQQLRAELQPRYVAIVDTAESGIVKLLTGEQRKQFETLLKRREFLWRPPEPTPPMDHSQP